jgi:hypothetical protein
MRNCSTGWGSRGPRFSSQLRRLPNEKQAYRVFAPELVEDACVHRVRFGKLSNALLAGAGSGTAQACPVPASPRMAIEALSNLAQHQR